MPIVVQLWSTGLLVFLVKKLLVITTDYWCVLANYCASNLSYHILRYVILNLSIAYMTVFLDAVQLLWRRVQPYHHQKRAGKWDPTTASLLIFTIAHQGVHQPWQVFFFVSAWLLRNTLSWCKGVSPMSRQHCHPQQFSTLSQPWCGTCI